MSNARGDDEVAAGARVSAAKERASRPVDCPPELDDPAWSYCDGSLSKSDNGTCVCFTFSCTEPNHCKVPDRASPCPKDK